VFPADVGIVRDRASVARHYNAINGMGYAPSCGDSRVCVTIFVTMSGAEQNLDDSVVHYYGSEALMMSCRAILVVRVCVGVRASRMRSRRQPAPHTPPTLSTLIS